MAWPEKRIAGTIDWIGKVNDKWTIIDWKTNEEIKMSAYQNAMMHSPFDDVPDCNFGHYTAQLNTYRVMLREVFNMDVGDNMRLVHLQPSGAFKIHKIPVIEGAVYAALDDFARIAELIAEKGAEHERN